MQKLGFNMRALRKTFEEHGVDTSKPLEKREERIKRDNQRFTALLKKQQSQELETQSLYPNNSPVTFKFSDWKPQMQPNEQQAREIGTRCFRYAQQLSKKPINLFLNGGPGVGKTSLALAMIDMAKQEGLSTLFISTAMLRALYDNSFGDEVIKRRLFHIKYAMKKVDVLVLDDFGTEGGSISRIEKEGYTGTHQTMQRDIYEVANDRWDFDNHCPGKTTIITSNNLRSDFKRIYDPKTISRIIPEENSQYAIPFLDMQDVRMKG